MTSRRSISSTERMRLFRLHDGECHDCHISIDPVRDRWEISHEIPLALGGADDDLNRKPIHYTCHKRRTARRDIPMIAKAVRIEVKFRGAFRPRTSMAGSRASPWKRTFNRGWERRI